MIRTFLASLALALGLLAAPGTAYSAAPATATRDDVPDLVATRQPAIRGEFRVAHRITAVPVLFQVR